SSEIVTEALGHLHEARAQAQERLRENPTDPAAIRDFATCTNALSAMLAWQWWELSKQRDELQSVIEALQSSIVSGNAALANSGDYPLNRLALAHLRLMLLLRIKDQDRDRPDIEAHREAILKLKIRGKQTPRDISHLRWNQAIVLADAGDADGSRRLAL